MNHHGYTRTDITGENYHNANIADALPWPSMCITVRRLKYFMYTVTTTNETSSRTIISAVGLPAGDRNAYYMAKDTSRNCSADTKVIFPGSFNEYEMSTSLPPVLFVGKVHKYMIYHDLMHWLWPCNMDGGPITCVARKVGEIPAGGCYNEEEPDPLDYKVCSADGNPKHTVPMGPWGQAFIGSAEWPIPVMPPTTTIILKPARTEVTYVSALVNSNGATILQKGDREATSPLGYWWWRASPDKDGGVAWVYTTRSCLGVPVTNYCVDVGSGVQQTVNDFDDMGETTILGATYVGVIS